MNDFQNKKEKQLFAATCADCKKQCEIPFIPSGDRPVYCSDCFKKKGGSSGNDRPRFENRSNEQIKNQLEAISAKLDRVLKILAQNQTPTSSSVTDGKSLAEVLKEAEEKPKATKEKTEKKAVAKKKK